MTKKFNGFTLAEVLITLGIIGVVAAMTMPTLINQTNGAQYRAAYKKALSAISQGVTLNVALDDISFADTVDTSATSGTTLEKLISDRMNVVKSATSAHTGFPAEAIKVTATTTSCKVPLEDGACPAGQSQTTNNSFTPDKFLYFNDGSMFAYDSASAYACTKTSSSGGNKVCLGVIDVNGAKGPNKLVVCDGEAAADYAKEVSGCQVKSPTDIYPVQFYDQTILPATSAAEAVLYGK